MITGLRFTGAGFLFVAFVESNECRIGIRSFRFWSPASVLRGLVFYLLLLSNDTKTPFKLDIHDSKSLLHP